MRTLTDVIVERGAPATAVHSREIVMQVFRWAIERGQKVENPADLVRPTSIAKFEPRDRALPPDEIALMYQYMDRIGTRSDYIDLRALRIPSRLLFPSRMYCVLRVRGACSRRLLKSTYSRNRHSGGSPSALISKLCLVNRG